jgi:polysaccharide deacetylase 2 family uncharacterized protein YibQ
VVGGRAKWWVIALTAGVIVVGGLAVSWWLGPGRLTYQSGARVELPIPPLMALGAADDTATASQIEARQPMRLAPAPPDPSLIENGPFGPLPRIGLEGRRPLLAYARPFDLDQATPRIAILVTGLGLQAEITDTAIALPAVVSLQFSPYGLDLPALIERARGAGHEVLIELPMEPLDYPASDPGPHTLLAEAPVADNLERLDWLLARAAGYVALGGSGDRFATSAAADPVLSVLAERGLGIVETSGFALAAAAERTGLPHVGTSGPIDEEPSVLAIDYALAALEAEAAATGSAVGIAQAYPVSLERIRLWADTLDDKGLVLAPVSALLIERAGLDRLHRGQRVQPSAG